MIICIFIAGCKTAPEDKTEEVETQFITRNPQNANTIDNNITPTVGIDINIPVFQNDSITDTVTAEIVTPTVIPTQPVDDTSNTIDSNTFDLESFKRIIINLVNDDLWYKTPDQSYFHPFESSTMNMEVYTKEDEPSCIWAIFNDSKNNKDHFTGVRFVSDKRGFLNEYEVFFGALTHLKAEAMMDDGFTFYGKTEITFGEATKPVYPVTTIEKNEIVDGILIKITQAMKIWRLSEGVYKVYVRNFRDNSGHTSAVIENSKGDKLIMEVNVYDDGSSEVDSVEELDDETLETWSDLIKDNTVRVEDVTLE